MIQNKKSIYLLKRETDAIWKNLYEFPNLESKENYENEMLPNHLLANVMLVSVSKEFKHLLSHQTIHAKLFICEANLEFIVNEDWILVDKNELDKYPIHRLMEKLLEEWQSI